MIGLAFLSSKFGGLIQASLTLMSVMSGPPLGVFFLGFCVPFCSKKGAIAGFITSLVGQSCITFKLGGKIGIILLEYFGSQLLWKVIEGKLQFSPSACFQLDWCPEQMQTNACCNINKVWNILNWDLYFSLSIFQFFDALCYKFQDKLHRINVLLSKDNNASKIPQMWQIWWKQFLEASDWFTAYNRGNVFNLW